MTARAALLLLLVLLPGPAFAHSVLTETRPEDATRLEAPPAEVWLRFNEAVQPLTLRLVDRNGHAADADLAVRGPTLALVPRSPLASGPWVVDYRVISADGHPVSGTIGFGVAAPPPADEQPPDPDADLIRSLGIAARALHYGGLLAAAGGGLFLVLITGVGWRLAAPVTAGIRAAVLVALAGAIASLGLTGVAAAGLPLAALGQDIAPWQIGLASSLGTSVAAAAAGLALLVAGLAAEPGPGARLIVTLGAFLAAGSLALTGHAADAGPRLLALPLVVLHNLAAAFWAGSLWPLALALRRLPAAEAAAVVRRFSTMALLVVPLLILAGAGLSLVQAQGSPDPLATDYGRTWLYKIGGVSLLLVLAAVNKLRLTPALVAGTIGGPRGLRHSIALEAALMVAVVTLTATLAASPPPRAVALAMARIPPPEPAAVESAPGYVVMAGTTLGTAVIELAPARTGTNTLTVSLPGGPARARLRLIPPVENVPTLAREVESVTPGHYRAAGLDLSISGRWTVIIETPDLVIRTAVPVVGPSPESPTVAQ